MSDFSFVTWGTTDFHLAIVASHLVVEGGFDLITVESMTIVLSMVVQVAGPSVAPTVGNWFPFSIKTLGSTCVNFGSVWSYCCSDTAFKEGSDLRIIEELYSGTGIMAFKKIR